MSLIQILIILFVVFVLYRTFLRYKNKDITGRELGIWVVFWALVALATAYPKKTDVLANLVGVERGADLLVYLSVIVLFFVVFKIIVKLEKVDKDVTEVVRNVALSNEDKKIKIKD